MSSEESSSLGIAGFLLLLAFSGKALDGSFTRICYLLERWGERNEYTLILETKFYAFYLMCIKIEVTLILIGLLNQQRKKNRKLTETKEIFIKPIYKWHITCEFHQLPPRYRYMLSRWVKKLKFWPIE